MNCHESQQNDTSDSQIKLARTQPLLQLGVPSALQTNNHMQHGTEKDVLLYNVGWKSKACPIQTNIEVPITVEIIGTSKNMEVADGMNHHEQDEENGTACQTDTIT